LRKENAAYCLGMQHFSEGGNRDAGAGKGNVSGKCGSASGVSGDEAANRRDL